MYCVGIYPESWKKSFIHFIPKPNGKGVRPIALTSCFCKIFEALIRNRLQWWCEFHNLLPQSQNGFRKGRSCADNLTNLTLDIDEALKNRKNLLAAFLDVSSAFDDVICDILLEKLVDVGCSPQIIRFVKFLTHERFFNSNLLGEIFRKTCKGLPHARSPLPAPISYLCQKYH